MKKQSFNLFSPSPVKRLTFFLIADIVILVASLYLSFLLRLDFVLGIEYKKIFLYSLPFFLGVKLFVFWLLRIYRMAWRYIGIEDFMKIISAITVSELMLVAIIFYFPPDMPGVSQTMSADVMRFPRSIFLIDGSVSILFFSGLRISKRIFLDVLNKNHLKKHGKKTLIIGAGNTGEMILRDMLRHLTEFCPVGFLDDDRNKIGNYIHGIRVLGRIDKLKEMVSAHRVELVVIAIPSLNHNALKSIYDAARNHVDAIKIVPRIYNFHKPTINLKGLEDIKIEDLIGRQSVEVDREEIEKFIKKKVILVTGAGGSIGSEIVCQIAAYQPERVVLFDIDETDLHNMEIKLKKTYPQYFKQRENNRQVTLSIRPSDKFIFVVGDVLDKDKVNRVFKTFRPDMVFHAAAYKHVPMMEYNPEEAVKVNMFGTYTVARAAVNYKVKKFIMISTDKAVRPTSVMGATKKMAENICSSLNGYGETAFMSVRFGNVLGSRGSVLPLFMDQLKAGGPITVTHKDMKRYFMTIPEATLLVLMSSMLGQGGNILVLDMGDPIRIAEFAEELIRINGLVPYKDIDIEFIGLRPGEKLFEEIFTKKEVLEVTSHKKIFVAKDEGRYSLEEIEYILKVFESNMNGSIASNEFLKELLKKYVEHMTEKKSA
ncbi:MAG: polysaccharide biosynthesis protein [Deltaproteobacteria bacterium]|nr:polysaccharide biosynthesis protein [Deltaproteobacteria bacterium]